MANMTGSFLFADLKSLENWMVDWSKGIRSGDILLLSGPMGVGKSQFVQTFVACLGGEKTASPTFAIHHQYSTPSVTVHHFDLYRIQDEEDLESTGFWDIINSSDGVVAIEWADRLDPQIFSPGRRVFKVALSMVQKGARQVVVQV